MSSKPVNILVIDNDPAMRRALRNFLSSQGYRAGESRSGEEALQNFTPSQADLILLDIEMPGMGGIEACRRFRALAPQAGIVMLTVCDTEDSKIRALEAGADDYITKPFSLREFTARLRAICRKLDACPVGAAVLRVGEPELDLDRRILRRSGVELHLSPIEFSLLSYMMQHTDVPIEYGRLLRAIWGPEYGCELEYLRTYIKRLRKKIEPDAAQPEYLVTVPWLGYRFRAPLAVAPATAAGGGALE